MFTMEKLKIVMHSLASVVVIFIAIWIYYYDSPTVVFGGIVAWIYFKEVKDYQTQKKIRDLQNLINENLNKTK